MHNSSSWCKFAAVFARHHFSSVPTCVQGRHEPDYAQHEHAKLLASKSPACTALFLCFRCSDVLPALNVLLPFTLHWLLHKS